MCPVLCPILCPQARVLAARARTVVSGAELAHLLGSKLSAERESAVQAEEEAARAEAVAALNRRRWAAAPGPCTCHNRHVFSCC